MPDFKLYANNFLYGRDAVDGIPSFGLSNLQSFFSLSGLAIPPMGVLVLNGDGSMPNNSWNSFNSGFILKMKDSPRTFSFQDSQANTFFIGSLYNFGSARYCRRLTDAELGYKLYVDNVNDRVIMLPYGQSTTLTALPPGLERGIALRYANFSEMKVYQTWSAICAEADMMRPYIDGVSARPTLPTSPNVGGYTPGTTKPDPYIKGATGNVYMVIGTDGDSYNMRGWDWGTDGIGAARPSDDGVQTGTYNTIIIGEYVWTAQNLKLKYKDIYTTYYDQYNITQAYLDAKFASMGLPSPTLGDFVNLFGTWITELPSIISYRSLTQFYNTAGGTQQIGWDLPDEAAILQLLGQMPHEAEGGDNGLPPSPTYTDAEISRVGIKATPAEDVDPIHVEGITIKADKTYEDVDPMGVKDIRIKTSEAGRSSHKTLI
jgi:hypothetical protein